MHLSEIIYNTFHTLGYEITRYIPDDLDEDTLRIVRNALPYTMTGPIRIAALVQAVRYIVKNKIPGDFVECGVWKGGSMVAVALTLLSMGIRDRRLYLYDTFEGMTKPGAFDISTKGFSAERQFSQQKITEDSSNWCNASLESVRKVLIGTGYPSDYLVFVPGKVEDTLPQENPGLIALLRLDTDWYESTRHELVNLYPLLHPGGVLILDDYGAWLGARRAVDEYFLERASFPLLNRIDGTGRIAIKPVLNVRDQLDEE